MHIIMHKAEYKVIQSTPGAARAHIRVGGFAALSSASKSSSRSNPMLRKRFQWAFLIRKSFMRIMS
jgi:hypothetical protein